MRDVPLKIPRRTIVVGWLSERNDASLARAQMLDDALYRAVFSSSIAALENEQDPVTVLDDVPLDFDEFNLQVVQRGAISLAAFMMCGSLSR